jgi:hypothetical protein
MKRIFLALFLASLSVVNAHSASARVFANNDMVKGEIGTRIHYQVKLKNLPQLTYQNDEGNTYSGDSSNDDSGEDFEKE